MTDNYPERDQDIESWYYAFYFHKIVSDGTANLNDAMELAKENAKARREALIATGKLNNSTENSILLQLRNAQKTGWYRLAGSYADIRDVIEDMLSDTIERNPHSTRIGEIRNILRLLDALEAKGYSPEKLVVHPGNVSKMITASKRILDALSNDAPQEEQLKVVDKIIDAVADPQVSYRKFEEQTRTDQSTLNSNLPPPVQSKILLTSSGEFLVVKSTPAHTEAILKRTKGIVDHPAPIDGATFLKEMSQVILPGQSNMIRLKIDNTNGTVKLCEALRGFLLPTVDEFCTLLVAEVARSEIYIRQGLERGAIWIPVLRMDTWINKKDLDLWIMEKFNFQVRIDLEGQREDPLLLLQQSVKGFYVVPEDVMEWYPGTQWSINVLHLFDRVLTLGVFVVSV